MSPDDARGTSGDGVGFRVAYGRQWSNRWSWEAAFWQGTLDTGNDGGSDFYQQATAFDVFYGFGRGRALRSHLRLGVGLVQDDVWPNAGDGLHRYVSGGFGLRSRPLGGSNVSLHGGIGYLRSDFEAGASDWHLSLGVSITIGPSREVVPEAPR